MKLRVLEMFAGIGGFSLGLHRAGGYETVALIEMKPHARAVLAKNFPGVPCHDDVTTYEYREGEADVITAGFPCQDLSYAGAGAGLAGSRSGLYREVIRALRLVRPLYAILENVAALLSRGLGTVLGDLAEIGNDAEWHCIPARAVGAPHLRDRIWIIAHARGEQHEGCHPPISGEIASELSQAFMANTYRERELQPQGPECDERGRPGDCGQDVANTSRELRNGRRAEPEQGGRPEPSDGCADMADTDSHDVQGLIPCGPDTQGRAGPIERPAGPCRDGLGWWAVEPDVGRVAHGVPARVDRLAELGNAVVPQIPEVIGRALNARRAAEQKRDAA